MLAAAGHQEAWNHGATKHGVLCRQPCVGSTRHSPKEQPVVALQIKTWALHPGNALEEPQEGERAASSGGNTEHGSYAGGRTLSLYLLSVVAVGDAETSSSRTYYYMTLVYITEPPALPRARDCVQTDR